MCSFNQIKPQMFDCNHFASLTNHLGHFASLKNHLLVAQVLMLNNNLHECLSIKTCVSLLKTRGEKEEEKMKKKRKRKKKEVQLCSKQCRRVGPEGPNRKLFLQPTIVIVQW